MLFIEAIEHDHLTFLVTEYGKSFTAKGFGNWFRKQCNEAGLPQCSAHGLRKAAMVRMAMNGKTTKHGQSMSGHNTLSEVERYTRQADRALLADAAIDGLDKPISRT